MNLPNLFQKTAKGAIVRWRVWTEGADVCTEWGQIDGKQQRQRYPAQATNVGRSNERDAWAQAAFEAGALHTKKKRLKYYESIEEATTTVNMKPMRAQDYSKRKDELVFPVSMQPKLDGLRCFAYNDNGNVRLMSRGGKDYYLTHIIDAVAPFLQNIVLDGELYAHGMMLEDINSLTKKPREESKVLKLHVYDCTYGLEEPWGVRMGYLERMQNLMLPTPEPVHWVETLLIGGHTQIKHYHDLFVSDGYEGGIVRTMDHTYRYGYRSPGLLKVKEFDEKEFKVVGWTKGKDNVPLWIVVQEDGNEFEVRPRGTEKQRAEAMKDADAQVGKWLTVRFIGRTKDNNIPKFAVGIVIREEAEFA